MNNDALTTKHNGSSQDLSTNSVKALSHAQNNKSVCLFDVSHRPVSECFNHSSSSNILTQPTPENLRVRDLLLLLKGDDSLHHA